MIEKLKRRVRVTLIINKNARRSMYNLSLKEIIEAFNNHGLAPTIVFTDSYKKGVQEARLAAKNKADIVIAVGGDGTINSVINGIAGTRAKLGVLPWGTENSFSKELGMPKDLNKAAEIFAQNSGIKVDLGKINDRYFLLWAGIGIDAAIISEVEPLLKKLFGNPAYIATILKTTLTYDFPEITLRINRKTVKKGRFVIVGNIKNYAIGWKATPLANFQDGLLDFCVVKDVSDPLALMRIFMEARKGKHIELPEVEYFRAKKMQILTSKPCLIHTDGDVATQTPAKLKIIPGALTLVKPMKFKKKPKLAALLPWIYRGKKRK